MSVKKTVLPATWNAPACPDRTINVVHGRLHTWTREDATHVRPQIPPAWDRWFSRTAPQQPGLKWAELVTEDGPVELGEPGPAPEPAGCGCHTLGRAEVVAITAIGRGR
ncbi:MULTISPECIES: hypothetical protein [Catenuloplanes]|uniref:Uncharacterized protein n=1 Tax=Catenuloplanes niger TaxID=587534 RepID=A0AAE3ZSL7_9ACTN|nr:hypothetical protein [Catenuloplanes niger]MDR7323393.1 hypothetical protein [Catenuloplanes niger]